MLNPFESLLKDRVTDVFSVHWAGKVLGGSALALTFIGSVSAEEPKWNQASKHRLNPFVQSADQTQTDSRQVTTETKISVPTPSLQPMAKVRLQVPHVKMASTPSNSVFVGPQWDSETTRSEIAQPIASIPAGSIAAGAIPQRAGTPTQSSNRPTRLPAALPDPPNAFAARPTHQTKLASASQKRAEFLSNQAPSNRSQASVYLATQTARSQFEIAAGLLQQAQLEYDCSAFASAETSVWQSLERSAQAIDLNRPNEMSSSDEVPALKRLHRGRRALIEACDFVGPFAQQDPAAIARLSRAHETPVLRETLPPMRTALVPSSASKVDLPTGSEAIDRYLDYARMQFSVLSENSLLAAQTLDLLAAIRLGRNELSQLPGPTAICLRRAAVQGQSSNADLVAKLGHHLADVGLIDEARWALRHSLSLQPNQANAARLAAMDAAAMQSGRANVNSNQIGRSILAATRPRAQTPEVITMSPELFASISQSVMPGRSAVRSATPPTNDAGESMVARTVASRASDEPSAEQTRSFLKAFTASFRTDQAGATTLPPESSAAQPSMRKSSRSFPAVKKWW